MNLSQRGNCRCRSDAVGDERPICGRAAMSASPPIVLQNSKVAGLRIFLENAKRETIADSYNLNRVSEVACEFTVRRCGPSHLYTKTAPVARRIFDHQCKTSFATQSGGIATVSEEGHIAISRL